MTRADYIGKYGNLIITSTYGTGLFPSVKAAQAIIESSNSSGHAGQSRLAREYNAHFGIKAGTKWKGDSIDLATFEVIDGKKKILLTVSGHTKAAMTVSLTIPGFYRKTPAMRLFLLPKPPKLRHVH